MRGCPVSLGVRDSLRCLLTSKRGARPPRADVPGGRLRVREAQRDPVEERVAEPRRDEVEDLRDVAGDHVHRDRAVLERPDHLLGGLFRCHRRRAPVGVGRADHRGAHQRHADVGERHAVAVQLPPGDPAEHVERGLRRDVGGELRRLHLHAPGEDVDHVPVAPLDHPGQQPEHQPHRCEVVDRHRPLEVVHAVVGQRDRAADGATGVVDEHVDAAVLVRGSARRQPSTAGPSVRSQGYAAAVPPRASISRCTWASPSARRATSSTVAPRSAHARAVAAPMPDEAPVTRIRLPARGLRGSAPGSRDSTCRSTQARGVVSNDTAVTGPASAPPTAARARAAPRRRGSSARRRCARPAGRRAGGRRARSRPAPRPPGCRPRSRARHRPRTATSGAGCRTVPRPCT